MTKDQKEYKALSERLGPELQQELHEVFPKAARRHDVSIASSAGHNREQSLYEVLLTIPRQALREVAD